MNVGGSTSGKSPFAFGSMCRFHFFSGMPSLLTRAVTRHSSCNHKSQVSQLMSILSTLAGLPHVHTVLSFYAGLAAHSCTPCMQRLTENLASPGPSIATHCRQNMVRSGGAVSSDSIQWSTSILPTRDAVADQHTSLAMGARDTLTRCNHVHIICR